jgi:hypothetical protein
MPPFLSIVRRHLPLILLVLWCAAGVGLRCGPSATVLNSPYALDSLIPLSGAWALHSGLRIHTDFSSPLGLACYLPYYWTMETFGNTANVIRQVDAEIYVVVSILAFLLLKPPRFSWPVAALGVALASLVAASPCAFGDPPTIIWEGDRYNFLCVALGFLCLLTAASKTNLGAKEAALLAFCLVWAAFVKFNYFAINLAFIMAATVYSRITYGTRWLRFYSWLAGCFALFAALFVLCFRVDLTGMFHDLHMAAAARFYYVVSVAPNTDYFGITHHGLSSVVTDIFLVMGHQLVALLLLALFAWLQRSLAAGVLVAFVLALDFGQNLFNAYAQALPMISCLFLLGASEGQSQPEIRNSTFYRARQWLFLPVIFYIVWFAAGHIAAFAANLHPPRQCPTIHAAGFERIYFSGTCDDEKPTSIYATQLNSGLDLLRLNKLDGRRVFVFDFINPFPFLLATPYPKGQPVWMHADGTFNLKHYVPAETILAGTDVVLFPHKPVAPVTESLIFLFYNHWVLPHYKPVAINGDWAVLVKNK